jgi:general secretion pathway protein N
MRVRLPLARSLFFVSAWLFALFALLPLRLALGWLDLDRRGFAARESQGSLWFGAVGEARWGEVELGDLAARLRALPLLLGRARLDLKRSGGGAPLEGAIIVSRHGFGIEDASGRLPVSMSGPLPLATLDLDDFSVGFDGGLCRRAEGKVKAGLGGEIAGVPLPASLAGDVRCDGGLLLLPLSGPSGMERLDLRLGEDGRYRAELLIRPGDPVLRERLSASGFAPAGQGWVLRFAGKF